MATSRVGGLISGMDTDSMVKALTLSQQNKIDKLRQQNTLGTWQQTEYRTIITKLNDFKDKYFSNLNPLTNLSSAATLGQYTSNVTKNGAASSAVSATVTGSLRGTAHTINVEQLASKASYQGGSSPVALVSGNSGAGELDLNAINNAIAQAGQNGGSGSIRFAASYDGTTKAIELKGNYSSAADLASDINTQLQANFNGKVSASVTQNGKLSFATTEAGHTFGVGDVKGGAAVVGDLGFDDLSFTTMSLTKKLENLGLANGAGSGSFTINGTEIKFDAAKDTMQDVFNKVNDSGAGVRMYYSEVSNSVVMESKNTGAANQITWQDGSGSSLMSSLFGKSSSAEFDKATTDPNFQGKMVAGQDAKFTIDGVQTSRSSNSFEIEGIAYTLNDKTNGDVNVNFTQDTSKVKDLIVGFVKDYNALISYINGKTREEKTGFEPLTDEQKSALTEYEIKEWESNAKSGILKNDSLLRDAMTGMFNSVFRSSSESGVTAYSLGIMQTGTYSDGGQIKLDVSQLEKALTQNPEAVQSFFTNTTGLSSTNGLGGLAANMQSVLTKVASTDLVNQGTLVSKAGVPGKSSEYFNTISTQARERNSQITTLLEALTKKQNDLYSRYAKMESTLNTMNQQLSALSRLG